MLVVVLLVHALGCEGELRFDRAEASRGHRAVVATVGDATTSEVASDTGPATDTGDAPERPDSSEAGDVGDVPVVADVPDWDDASEVDESTDVGDTADTDVVEPPLSGPVLYPTGRVHSPITVDLAERLRALAGVDPALQDDVFMKVGASSFAQASFVRCFAGNFDLAAHAELESTRAFFAVGNAGGTNPFSRVSLAAESGRSAVWAITGDPSPMEREYLATSPRFAFVMYGANDMHRAATIEASLFPFAENMWTLVDELIAWGVTPILLTIPRRLDNATADRWVSTYNSVIRGLAQGRAVPLIDVNFAFSGLPGFGLGSDGLHASTYSGGACVLSEDGLRYGHNMRNLRVLEALARVEAVVVDHVAGLDAEAPRLAGDGSPSAPFEISQLPFADMRNTADSPYSRLDTYPGCGSNANERGPEWLYRVDVATRVRVRATVHDLGDTDIDLHLLGTEASGAGCVQRDHRIIDATLDPGVYHFALDSFVSSGGAVRSGEYLFTVIDCDADAPGCR